MKKSSPLCSPCVHSHPCPINYWSPGSCVFFQNFFIHIQMLLFSLFPIREHSIHTVLYFACVPNHIFWKPFHISTQRASSFFVFYSYIVFLVTCIHLVTWSLYHGHLGCFQSVSHYGHTPMHHFAHMQPYFHRYVIPVFLLD